MFSVKILCFVPVFLVSSAPVTGAQKVITASRGDTVLLLCPSPFNYTDRVNVKWVKDGKSSLCSYFMDINKTSIPNCESRFKVNESLNALIITDITSSDAGVYNCSLNRVIPPPSLFNFTALILQVSADLTVQQMNSSNVTCVNLLCSLEGLSPAQVNFTWTRRSEQLLHHISLINMSSELILCKPDWRDGDMFTCQASYSSNHTVYTNTFTLKGSSEAHQVAWIVIGSVIFACVVLLLIILIGVSLYKCKKKASTGSTVYTNKVYENFSYLTPTTNAEPSPRPAIPTTPRPSPQGASRTRREECIYEN